MTLEKMRLSMLAVAETGSTKAVDVLGRVMNETLALVRQRRSRLLWLFRVPNDMVAHHERALW